MMKRRLFTIGIILIISSVLAVLLADFFRQTIIIPIAQFFNGVLWIVRSFIESIDQVIFWVSFLIIALIIAGTSLFNPSKIVASDNLAVPKHKSQIAVWRERIDNLHRGEYFKWRLAKNLGGLAIEVIAFRHGLDPAQALIQLEEQSIIVPDDILAYIIAGQRSSPLKSNFLKIGEGIYTNNSSPLELDPEVLLNYLDTQLGNHNDNMD